MNKAVQWLTYFYDGDGNRVKSTINGVTTTFIGNYFEWAGDINHKTRYYYAGGQRIAMRQGNGVDISTLTYLFGDHLGSTSLTFKADTGATTAQLYKPWGEVRYPSGPNALPTDYTYTGQYSYQDDFGLMFYNARWYDSALGRFAQADSMVPDQFNPQSWDHYAYVGNNPINNTDPDGHCWPLCTAIGGAIIGAIAGVGLYAANVASSGQNFDIGQAITVAGVGALAGGLIGTGIGAVGGISVGVAAITTSAGTGIAASGGGYLLANTITQNDFQTTGFAIASSVGAASGALGPVAATTLPSAIALGASTGAVQYEANSLANTGSLAFDFGFWASTGLGALGGAAGGPFKPAEKWGNYPSMHGGFLNVPRQDISSGLRFDPTNFQDVVRDAMWKTFISNFPRSVGGGIISNLEIPQPE